MLKVVVVVAVVLAAVAYRDGSLLERTHLVATCSAIATPQGATGSWRACRPGKLEGRPDLSARACTRRGLVANVELWRCPAGVRSRRTA